MSKHSLIGLASIALVAISSAGTALAQTPCGPYCRGQNPVYTYPDGQKLYDEYCSNSGQNANATCFIQSCPAVCPFPTSTRRLRKPPKGKVEPH